MRRLLVTLLIGVAACFDSPQGPERDRDAPLQTERLSYSFVALDGYYTTPEIRITLRNTTGRVAVLIGGLNDRADLFLERLVDGEWVTRYRTAVPDGIRRVQRLQPGAVATIRTTIEGFPPGACDDCGPTLDLEDGMYRFRIAEGYVDSFDDELERPGEELPIEARISNRFALDAP